MEEISSIVKHSGQKEVQLEFERIEKSFRELELIENQVIKLRLHFLSIY